MIATISQGMEDQWDLLTPLAVHAYNTTVHNTTKQTPFFLMFGRDPSPVLADLPKLDVNTPEDYKEVLRQLRILRQDTVNQLRMARERNKEAYDRTVRPIEIEVDDVVLLECAQQPRDTFTKLNPKYVGPYRVVDKHTNILSVIPIRYPDFEPKSIHVDRVRKVPHDYPLIDDQRHLMLPFLDPASIDPNLEFEAPE